MRERLHAFLAVSFALLLGAAASARPEDRPWDPVVFIENSAGYVGTVEGGYLGGNWTGSGFVLDVREEIGKGGGAPDSCRLDAPAGTAWVVTNEHVVRSANELYVTFLREEEGGAVSQLTVPARVVAMDAVVDLALLRVEPEAIRGRGGDPALVRSLSLWGGEPADLPQGTAVAAMGSPLGLKRSVSEGIVSAPQQEIDGSTIRLIQTDAAVNPGNSGGPLVLAGKSEVVGVNSSGFHSERVSGINLAIPARRVRILLRQALCGSGPRFSLAPAVVEPVDDRLRSVLGLAEQTGAVIVRRLEELVTRPTPIQEMDVVLEIRGRSFPEAGGQAVANRIGKGGVPFDEAVLDLDPAADAVFKVWRRGKIVDLTVPLEALENPVMDRDHYVRFLGAFLEEVPQLDRFREKWTGEGVLVGNLQQGTTADDAGLVRGDVLQRVLLRDAEGTRSWSLRGLSDLRAAAGEIEGRIEAARKGGRPVLVAFKVWNFGERDHSFRFLRVQENSAGR